MADNNLDILIRILTDSVGADRAKEIVNQVRIETVKAGEEGAEAFKDLGKNTDEASEASHKFIGRSHEVKAALHLLGDEIGILRGLSHFLFTPETLGMGALLVVIRLFGEARKEAEAFKALMDSMPDLSGVEGPMVGVKEALEKSATAATTLNQQIAGILQGEQTLRGDFEKTSGALDSQTETAKKLVDIEKQKSLARLEYLKLTHQIGDAEAEFAKSQIEINAEEKKARLDEEAEQKKIMAAREDFAKAQADLPTTQAQANDAQAASDQAAQHSDNVAKNLKTQRENLAKQQEFIAGTKDKPGLQEQVDSFTGGFAGLDVLADTDRDWLKTFTGKKDWENRGEPFGRAGGQFMDLLEKLSEAREKESAIAAQVRQLEGEEGPAKKDALEKSTIAKMLHDRAESLAKDVSDLGSRVAALESKFGNDNKIRHAEDGLEEQKSVNERTKALQVELPIASQAAKVVEAGGKIGADQSQILSELMAMLQGHGMTNQQILQFLAAATNDSKQFGKALSELQRDMKDIYSIYSFGR